MPGYLDAIWHVEEQRWQCPSDLGATGAPQKHCQRQELEETLGKCCGMVFDMMVEKPWTVEKEKKFLTSTEPAHDDPIPALESEQQWVLRTKLWRLRTTRTAVEQVPRLGCNPINQDSDWMASWLEKVKDFAFSWLAGSCQLQQFSEQQVDG